VGTNADGSHPLRGYFQSGSLYIADVTGTLGPYQFAGSSGFTAAISVSGTDNLLTGYHMTFDGTVTQTSQHATVSGGLSVYYPPMAPPSPTPVTGTFS
jgi:hypothetical protein